MAAFAAAAPLLVVLVLMLGRGWRAAPAGGVGLALATLVALGVFGLGTQILTFYGRAGALGGIFLEAAFMTVSILWIVFPALTLYELQRRSGAIETIRAAVGRISSHPRTQTLLIAFFFGLFMEGAAGFGAPVALAAPLLVALGHPPVRAVALALVGHAAGVSFGALGTPVLAQLPLIDAPMADVVRQTVLLNALSGVSLLAALTWMAGDERPRLKDASMTAAAGALFYIPFLAFGWFVGPELPTIGAALIGGAGFALIARMVGGGRSESESQGLVRAAAPYLIIVALVLLTRLAPTVRETLSDLQVSWSIGEVFGGAFPPLYHAGTILAAGLVLGGLAQGQGRAAFAAAGLAAARRTAPVALALLAMLMLSRMMVHGGLVSELAGTAVGLGDYWPLITPLLGALGSFVTGSATASNILLTPFQATAATSLGLAAAQMAAGQGFGAAVGNMVCPHNVIAGAATVGLKGGEADILRRTVLVALGAATLGGVVAWLMTTGS